jgi:hypothetical protein
LDGFGICAEQGLFELAFVAILRQRPSEAARFEAADEIVNGTLAEPDAPGDLPLRQVQPEVQAEHVV